MGRNSADVLQLSRLLAGDVKESRNDSPTRDLQMAADRTRVVRKYSVRPLNSLKTRHARLAKARPVAWRFEPLSSGERNRFGATTIRHNVQWAAILLPHPRGLWRLSGAQHIPAFLCSVAFSSACGEPVLTKAVGLLPRTSDPTQAADRCRSHQPCAVGEVLRLAISFGDRQTRNADRLASPAFQAVLEDEIAPGQTEATQKHPSTDCSNGGRKSDLGAGSRCRRVGSEAGHSGLTANGWGVLAEPTAQQRPLIAALEQLRSQSHSIVASLRFPSRGNGRLSPVVRLRADGNWHAEDCALHCHGPSDCRLDVAAVSGSSSRRTWTQVRNP